MNGNSTAVSGLLVIDKPADLTSHDVVAHLRRITGLQRIGHTGTLDPFATGLLLILIGKATRLTEYAHAARKTYRATFTLGATSTTDDLSGELTLQPGITPPSRDRVATVVQQFIGDISQVPPWFSAVKVRGKKLYEYARAGETTMQRSPRRLHIDSIVIESYVFPKLVTTITCSSGTYIRALARDIGQELGIGGYVSTLRRIKIGSLGIEKSLKLEELTEATWHNYLQPAALLLDHMPRSVVTDENVAQLKQGRAVETSEQFQNDDAVALYAPDGTLLGIGSYDVATKQLSPHKIL